MAGEHGGGRAPGGPSRLPPRVLGIVVVGVLALLLSLVSLGSGAGTSTGKGGPAAGAAWRVGVSAEVLVVPLVLVSAGMLGLLVLLWPGRRRRRRDDDPDWVDERPPAPWWERVLVTTCALLPLGGLIAALVWLRSRSQPQPPPQATGPGVPPTTGVGSAPPARPPAGLEWPHVPVVVMVGAVALVALALLGAWWLVRRHAPAGTSVVIPDRRRRVAGVLRETVDDLRREPDPRRAIVAAYARMEQTMLPQGLGRHPAETPLEYLRRLLGETRADPQPLRRLTGLFEQARFSHHPVGEPMREQAIHALASLRASLGSGG